MNSRPLGGRMLARGGEGREEGGVPDEPHEAFRGGVLAGLKLVEDQLLEGLRLGWGGELSVSDFLGAEGVSELRLCGEGGVGGVETLTFPNMSFLTGLKATDPRTSAMMSGIRDPSVELSDCEYQTTWSDSRRQAGSRWC